MTSIIDENGIKTSRFYEDVNVEISRLLLENKQHKENMALKEKEIALIKAELELEKETCRFSKRINMGMLFVAVLPTIADLIIHFS